MVALPSSCSCDSALHVRAVVWSILLMADRVRHYRYKAHDEPGWWVLALGDSFEGKSFSERDHLREQLRKNLERNGIARNELVWVWDETERAQLVLLTYADYGEACKALELLSFDGVSLCVALEQIEE
ncbi:hypothetical protein [Desulfovibrio inopinatus]|uniref:hypothetical protein n=1 Tax=Desulfovibrio inopinatus TaxID=102109 RepID=UPI0003F80DF7|nr:hypothetical protein [Desulfovibrio inopinatus]